MQTTLQRTLRRRGMDVTPVTDGAVALPAWRRLRPDAVLLDLSLPNMDGLDIIAQARAEGLATPTLILTARGTVGDRVQGLNAGADDYLPKPFDLDELEARLRALVRRSADQQENRPTTPAQITLGALRFDKDSGSFYLNDEPMEVTPREQALLRALLPHPGRAISKERLYEAVFPGHSEVQYEAIEVVVYRLRKKLADTGISLMTLRGLGYLLKAD